MSPIFMATILGVIAVGALLSLQAPINASLAQSMGDPMAAAALSFGIGFLALGAITLLRGEAASLMPLKTTPLWAYSGGLLGALWVFAAIWSVGQLGVVTMITAMILGQLICAMLIDAYGAFGLPIKEISWARVVSLCLVAGGLVLSRT